MQYINSAVAAADQAIKWGIIASTVFMASLIAVSLIAFLFRRTD
jgi:hypothetical protein